MAVPHARVAAAGRCPEVSAPSRSGLPYLPALDGLRGLAVAAVLLFHADLGLLPGGHLGVSVFFTLSGFLITSLLLVERARTGGLHLARFWRHRARRLVPGMLVCLPLAALVVHESPGPVRSGVLGDAIASAGWVANWRFILHHDTYADLFSAPSPFQHFWSLGVEEQFYVAFPLLLLLVLGRSGAMRGRRLLLAVLAVLTVGSTLELARLNAHGEAFSRAYYGTDSRIAELLVGALLAVAMVKGDRLRELGRRSRVAVTVAGVAGAAGLAYGFATLGTDDRVLYRGGFLAVAICSAAVIAAATQSGSPIARALSAPPLVLLGTISYGVYLFHWPVYLLVTSDNTGQSGLALLALRLLLTMAIAAASYGLLERPVRAGRLTAAQGLTGWAAGAVAGVAAVALATGVITVPQPEPAVTSAAGATGLEPAPGSAATAVAAVPPAARSRVLPHVQRPPSAAASRLPSASTAPRLAGPHPVPTHRKRTAAAVPSEFTQPPSKAKVPAPPNVPPGALKVAVIGDSVAGNLGQGLAIMASERNDVAVYNLALPGCPLTRGKLRRLGPDLPFDVDPSCAWWADPNSERRQALEGYQPDVIVTEDGINEVLDRKLDSWNDWRSPEDARFDAWVVSEYQEAVTTWEQEGAKVVVVNAPCADWGRYDAYRELTDPGLRVNDLNVGAYGQVPSVTHADLFQRVCPTGQYQDDVEGYSDGRPDGFHFTPDASAALARNWLGPIVFGAAQGAPPLAPVASPS